MFNILRNRQAVSHGGWTTFLPTSNAQGSSISTALPTCVIFWWFLFLMNAILQGTKWWGHAAIEVFFLIVTQKGQQPEEACRMGKAQLSRNEQHPWGRGVGGFHKKKTRRTTFGGRRLGQMKSRKSRAWGLSKEKTSPVPHGEQHRGSPQGTVRVGV